MLKKGIHLDYIAISPFLYYELLWRHDSVIGNHIPHRKIFDHRPSKQTMINNFNCHHEERQQLNTTSPKRAHSKWASQTWTPDVNPSLEWENHFHDPLSILTLFVLIKSR